MTYKTIIIFFALLSPSLAISAYLDRTEDANGWTVFTPSSDTDVVYVDPTLGNNSTCASYRTTDPEMGSNPFEPDGAVIPCADFATAYSMTGNGEPDWILIKRGETLEEYLGDLSRSGDSLTEPFLIGSYGTSGAIPVILPGANTPAIRITSTTSNLAIVGLEFYAEDRNPTTNGGTFPDGASGIYVYLSGSASLTGFLLEGCKLSYYEGNMIQNDGSGIVDVEFRRNILSNNYSTVGHSQGLFLALLDNVLFEENIMYHNGWYEQQVEGGRNDSSRGRATEFNHNIYWASNDNVIIKNNLLIDPSSAGIKLTGQYQTVSTSITGNLIIGGEVPMSLGNNYDDPQYAYRFPNVTISNNIITNSGRLNPTHRGIGYGLWLAGLDDATVSENLIINMDAGVVTGHALATNSDESRDVSWANNIVFNHGYSSVIGISSGSGGSDRITFSNNIIQLPDIINQEIIDARYDVRSELSFSGNIYFADSQTFDANGSIVDLSGWNAWSGDNSTWAEYTFPDDSRDVDTYMDHIGETATIDAFITAVTAQDRYNWNSVYSAATVNSWIMQGFGLEEYTEPEPTIYGNLGVWGLDGNFYYIR